MALDWRARISAPAWRCSSRRSPRRAPRRSATSPRSTGVTSGSTCGYAIWAPASSGSRQNALRPSRASDRKSVVQLGELRVRSGRAAFAHHLGHCGSEPRLRERTERLWGLPDVDYVHLAADVLGRMRDQTVGRIALGVENLVHLVVLLRACLDIHLQQDCHVASSGFSPNRTSPTLSRIGPLRSLQPVNAGDAMMVGSP